MDNSHLRPILDPANYGPWLLALRAAAFSGDCIEHFRSNPPKPQDAAGIKEYDKKQNYLIGKIIRSIPPEIVNLLLTPTSDPTPYDHIQQIKNHLDATNANDHKYLKQQAEETHFLPGTTLEEYVTAHEKIRARMIAAQYPNISDGAITVEFLIDGLKHNPYTSPIGLQLIALNPTDVKDFVHKFKRISSYQSATQNAPTPHGIPPPASPTDNRHQELLTRPRRRNPPPNRRRDPDFKPCNFHLLRGIRYPQHTDGECNHPDHPKNQRARLAPQPQVRFAQFDDDDSHDDDTQGMSILDTAAHPTHTPTPSADMKPLTTTVHTITATNDKRKCTHAGQITVKTNKGIKLTLPGVCNPTLQQNLLSVHDIAKRYGNVLFTPTRAIIYKDNHHESQSTILGTAPWNTHLHAYSWNHSSNPAARGARTVPSKLPQNTYDNTVKNRNKPPLPPVEERPHTPTPSKPCPAPTQPSVHYPTTNQTPTAFA